MAGPQASFFGGGATETLHPLTRDRRFFFGSADWSLENCSSDANHDGLFRSKAEPRNILVLSILSQIEPIDHYLIDIPSS